jgi:sugar lactone lactonase YvrE
VVDSAGNIFIADEGNNVVREVLKSNGTIRTYAGSGVAGNSGDGGLAIQARLNGISALAVDAKGNLYIADSANDRIREVIAATGIIQTVAGTGVQGFGGDGGAATSALLSDPTGLAIDSAGNLYIGDEGNNRIREVSKGVITTVAGSGNPGFGGDGGPATLALLNGPSAVAVDALGDLLIADTGNNRIREVLKGSGQIITLAGDGGAASGGDGGPSSGAEVDVPDGIAIDATGRLFVAEELGDRVRELTLNANVNSLTPTSSTVTSSLATPVYGQAVTFTATVTRSATGIGFPSGSVTFMDGSTVLGTSPLVSGTATLTLTTLSAGAHAITATYSGDLNFESSESPVLSQAVAVDKTTTALAVSRTASVFGQAVTFTATVKAASPGSGTPTGTVTFTDTVTNQVVGTATLVNGVATLTTSALDVGNHTIVASYGGDTNFSSSGSATASDTVTAALTKTILASTALNAKAGTAVTFTASVVAQGPGSGIPAGSVTFYLDGVAIAPVVTVDSIGKAQWAVVTLTKGTHTITAVYGGTSRYQTSTSATLTETIS